MALDDVLALVCSSCSSPKTGMRNTFNAEKIKEKQYVKADVPLVPLVPHTFHEFGEKEGDQGVVADFETEVHEIPIETCQGCGGSCWWQRSWGLAWRCVSCEPWPEGWPTANDLFG